jgi:hypothetical protein
MGRKMIAFPFAIQDISRALSVFEYCLVVQEAVMRSKPSMPELNIHCWREWLVDLGQITVAATCAADEREKAALALAGPIADKYPRAFGEVCSRHSQHAEYAG